MILELKMVSNFHIKIVLGAYFSFKFFIPNYIIQMHYFNKFFQVVTNHKLILFSQI